MRAYLRSQQAAVEGCHPKDAGRRQGMSSADILLGTSARRLPAGFHIPPRGGFSARDDEIGVPDGVAHGVRRGEAVALCGAVPRYFWSGPFTVDKSRVLEVCGSCRALAGP